MAEERSILLPLAGAAAGLALVAVSLTGLGRPSTRVEAAAPIAQAQSSLPYRVVGILVAKDEPDYVEPSPTATLPVATVTPVSTGSPTSTQSPGSPTATFTPRPPTATKTPGTPIMVSPTLTYTPTVVGTACGGATGEIIALDKLGETVTISATGDLTDWWLQSWQGSQVLEFPVGFVATGTVTIVSGVPEFANTADRIWWTAAEVWDDTRDDDAILRNCVGDTVSRFEDGM